MTTHAELFECCCVLRNGHPSRHSDFQTRPPRSVCHFYQPGTGDRYTDTQDYDFDFDFFCRVGCHEPFATTFEQNELGEDEQSGNRECVESIGLVREVNPAERRTWWSFIVTVLAINAISFFLPALNQFPGWVTPVLNFMLFWVLGSTPCIVIAAKAMASCTLAPLSS